MNFQRFAGIKGIRQPRAILLCQLDAGLPGFRQSDCILFRCFDRFMGVILSGNRLRETIVTVRRQHLEQDEQNGSESSIPILRHICNVCSSFGSG